MRNSKRPTCLPRHHAPKDRDREKEEKQEQDLLNSSLPHTGGFREQYPFGDSYTSQEAKELKEFEKQLETWDKDDGFVHREDSYSKYVQGLSTSEWPHLRYLAWWMQVTTSPAKYGYFSRMLPPYRKEHRRERADRTKVAVIDFNLKAEEPVKIEICSEISKLATVLQQGKEAEARAVGARRLFIVEDLSRNVIEHLGIELDMDPEVFRQQINDYMWFNTLDSWVELPDLDMVSRHRPFFRLSYMHPRYFRNKASFDAAKREAGRFNVLRRLDEDEDQKSIFDTDDAVCALVRCKASVWIKPSKGKAKGGYVAVMLIDPSITEGWPMWQGHRSFKDAPVPSRKQEMRPRHERKSLLDDMIHMIEQMSTGDLERMEKSPHAMFIGLYQIICAEWLSLTRYIQSRLNQIDWEIESVKFRENPSELSSLNKLHKWRRRLPLFRSMVLDAQRKLFGDAAIARGSRERERGRTSSMATTIDDCVLSELRFDFENLVRTIKELCDRTEQIVHVAAAVTSIEDSRREMDRNTILARLTHLAVIFAPLSFVSSLFSMATDLSEMLSTFNVYFAVALPITAAALLLVNPRLLMMVWRLVGGPRASTVVSRFLRRDGEQGIGGGT